jgi:thiol-disulfide isomerase/thioredoxin
MQYTLKRLLSAGLLAGILAALCHGSAAGQTAPRLPVRAAARAPAATRPTTPAAAPATAPAAATPPAASATGSAPAGENERFAQVVGRALVFLSQAETYTLGVQSKWKATGDAPGQAGQSNYRLLAQGGKYRIEVQAAGQTQPQLIHVNDGQHATTLLAAHELYSQHAADSPQARIESNQMLAQSLAGSAIDILLQPNVAEYVGRGAQGVKDHGQVNLAGQACHRFDLLWDGAQVELYFAAQGDPLLVQFVRHCAVPTGDDSCYEMVHTARFDWKLGTPLPEGALKIELPESARRVNDIYNTLAGEDHSDLLGKPLPKLDLSDLDGRAISLAPQAGQRGTVLIFWATWCTPSVSEMPSVSQFVKTYSDRGFRFFAVNVGEAPGDVRRFTAQSPIVSAIALDTQGGVSSALRIAQLPAAVVVGPDNMVRSIVTGTPQQVQAKVAEELAALAAEGEKLPATARRPGSTGLPK